MVWTIVRFLLYPVYLWNCHLIDVKILIQEVIEYVGITVVLFCFQIIKLLSLTKIPLHVAFVTGIKKKVEFDCEEDKELLGETSCFSMENTGSCLVFTVWPG